MAKNSGRPLPHARPPREAHREIMPQRGSEHTFGFSKGRAGGSGPEKPCDAYVRAWVARGATHVGALPLRRPRWSRLWLARPCLRTCLATSICKYGQGLVDERQGDIVALHTPIVPIIVR